MKTKLNYYDYQELKTYVDKMEDKSIEKQINCLNRQYLIDNFDYLYPDQETLWIDMIEKGISITEYLKSKSQAVTKLLYTKNLLGGI